MNKFSELFKTFMDKASESYKNDKISFFLIILIISAGIFFRTYQYGAEGGIEVDSPGAIAGSLKYYYPHDYYPGLLHQYPPLGSLIMGAGCLLSGENFSQITRQPPNYWPSIPYLIGEPYVLAEKYCLAPSYAASIILLIGLAALSFSLLSKYSAIYATTFFAFFGILIQWGRVVFYDIFQWMFVVYGVLFLWAAYKEEQGNKKERNCFLVSAILFGFGTAVKFSAGAFLLLEIFIIFEKYSFSVLNFAGIKKLSLKTLRNSEKSAPEYSFVMSVKHSALSSLAFLFAMLLPFNLSLKNFLDVKNAYFAIYPELGKITINPAFVRFFIDILFNSTIFDSILAVFSIYIFLKILEKTVISKKACMNERFILYLMILFIASLSTSTLFDVGLNSAGGRRIMLYLFSIVFLLSLAFSNAEYSIFNMLRIRDEQKKRVLFLAFIAVYILSSSAVLFYAAPYYAQTTSKNPLCVLNEKRCVETPWPNYRIIANALDGIMKSNETFYSTYYDLPINMYVRQKDYYIQWQIDTAAQEKFGRKPTISEMVQNFYFEGRRIRYVIVNSYAMNHDAESKEIFTKYAPYKTVSVNGINVAYIYDLENMRAP